MAKDRVGTQAQVVEHGGSADAGSRLLHWVQQRRRTVGIGVVSLVFIGGAGWFMQSAQVRRENFAASALAQARIAVDAGNLQLAGSDLGRVAGTYGNTRAGQEATVLLARVHLMQGQADLAVSELRTFLNGGPDQQFVSPAEGLLGGALEQVGDFNGAAGAFERAAEATEYDLVKAEFLLDAGRTAALGGDVARAIAAYEAAVDLVGDDNSSATEAKFRLAELRRQSS